MSDPFDTGELPPGLRDEYLAGMRAALGVLAAIGERLAVAGNDRQALETLQRETHKIHGSAGSYGFMDASRLAAGMEATAKDWVAHADDRDVDRGSLTRWFVARLAEMLGLQVPRPQAAAPRPPVRGVGPPPRPSQASAAKPTQPPRTVSRGVRAPVPPAPGQRTPPAAPPPPRPPARPRPQAPSPPPPAPARRPQPKAEPPAPSSTATELPWILSPEAAEKTPVEAEVEPAPSAPAAEVAPAAAEPAPPPAPPPPPPTVVLPPAAEAQAVAPQPATATPEPAPSAPPPPLATPVAEAPPAATEPAPAAASTVPEVIFVEDDAALAELLAYGLRTRGYRFAAYRNGRAALRELTVLDVQGTHPLLLLDVDLPALDGYSIFAALQQQRPGTYRVVFTTVHGSEEEQLRGLEAGALDYLVKPISLRVALEKIKRWVGR